MPLNRHIQEKKDLTTIDVVVPEKDGGLTPRSATVASVPITHNPPSLVTTPEQSTSASPPTGASSDTLSRTASPSSFTFTTPARDPSAAPSPTQSASASLLQTPSGPDSSGLPNTNSNSNLSLSTAAKRSNVGAITAGVTAGVIALFLLTTLLVRRRRRRNRYARTIIGSSSSLQIGAHRDRTAGRIVPDPFPAIRQFNASLVTTSSGYEVGGNQVALSEKARIYLEQQLLLSGALSSDWPQPMNVKHGIAQDATLAPMPAGAPTRLPQILAPRSTAAIPASPPASTLTRPPLMTNTPRVLGTVQDEDSGIRLMQHSDTGGFVEVLPPSYTAH